MKDLGFITKTLVILTAGLAVLVYTPGCHAGGSNKQVSHEQQKRLKTMQEKGVQVSLTIFPVIMGDSAELNHKIAVVVGVLLEEAGMTNLEITDATFRLQKADTFDRTAQLFGEFVRKNPIETDYALYAEFIGNPETGPKEIRSVIVDKTGQSVFVDRQTAADREFKRAKPHTPMTCCMFLVERVRTHLRIPKSARNNSGKGKFVQKLVENSPTPGNVERTAMKKRLAVMTKAGRTATIAVFPVRLSDKEVGKKEANHLAGLLSKKKLYDAKAVDSELRVKIQFAINEQKLLWDLARAFQDHIKQNPPEADYALLADYVYPRPGRGAWAVHFVICDRDGEWVIVDFQNEHHSDFQSVDPMTHDDCGRLVAKRLKGYLR